MTEWLKLSAQRQAEILNLTGNRTGLPAYAIEKDWWVTLCLKAVYNTPSAKHIVFKGGTSLSKSCALIERFSEDIDLALNREALGFSGELTSSKVVQLRKAAGKFISETLKDEIETALITMGVDASQFKLSAQATDQSDADPRVLELTYQTVIPQSAYIVPRVLIEIGARSLHEPSGNRTVRSIIGTEFAAEPFAGKPFDVETVEPRRTFLEKAFLLHEYFASRKAQQAAERMSRHLYDLEKLMDTEHGINALKDGVLYKTIVEHRERYTPVRGINYAGHAPATINFIPPDELISEWKRDYDAMRESMIYGEAKSFDELIKRITELNNRFRNIVVI